MYNKFPAIIFTLVVFVFQNISAQNHSSDYTRDTSYTVYSTYQKLSGKYPFIRAVQTGLPDSVTLEKNIVYVSYEERDLHLDLFQPVSKEYLSPAVLLIHGGGWRSGDKTMMHQIAIRLAENGFVAAAAEYRLSPEAKYPASVLDLKICIKWLKESSEKYGIDTNKISVLGCSAGGTLAALIGSTVNINFFDNPCFYSDHSSAVNAIIDIDGILDFTHPAESGKDIDPEKPSAGKMWLGESYKENPELWIEASPLSYFNENTPPVIFINSSEERFHAGRNAAIEKLITFGTYYEVHMLPDSPHSFWLFHPWFETTINYVLGFLNKINTIN